MKQILATFPLRNFLRVFALVTAVSATSCSKDPAVDGELHGDMLRFAVAEADGWNTQLRCGAAGSEEKSAASPENVAEVFSLRGENPADTLFLHASVADGIAAPYPNVQTDRLQTRATDSRIMWSWHIWVTDYELGSDVRTVTNYQGIAYKMMPVNIGWCDAETTTYDARSVKVRFTQAETGAMQVITLTQASHSVVNFGNQPYFQFGRKDPMLAGIRNASGSTVDKGCYSDGYAFDKSGTGKVAIGVSIQHPHIFYNYGSSSIYDWCATSYSNLWSGDNTVTTANDNAVVKTIYDPSPVGYHLPSSNAFTGFTYNGSNVFGSSYFGSRFNSPYTSTTDFTDNFGWEFYCNKMTGEGSYDTAGGTIFFPASGYRSYSAGTVNNVGSLGYFWSAVPYSTSYGRSLSFRSSYIYPLSINYRSDGFVVRPVQE